MIKGDTVVQWSRKRTEKGTNRKEIKRFQKLQKEQHGILLLWHCGNSYGIAASRQGKGRQGKANLGQEYHCRQFSITISEFVSVHLSFLINTN